MVSKKQNIMRNERGSALIVVLITLLVLAILTGVLLSILQFDNKANAAIIASTRADMLAQMGLDEVDVLIREAVSRAESTVSPGERNERIVRAQRIRQNLENVASYDDLYRFGGDRQSTGTYQVTVKQTVVSQPTDTRPDASYTHRLEIESTGSIEIPLRLQKTKQVVVYVSDLSPVFRYVLSSSIDGAIQINGSPSIVGDGYISNNLSTNPIVTYTDDIGDAQQLATTNPFWRGFLRTQNPEIRQESVGKWFSWPYPLVEKPEYDRLLDESFQPGMTPIDPDTNSTIQNSGIVGKKIEDAKTLVGVEQPISEDEQGTDLGRGATTREACPATCGRDTFSSSVSFSDWVNVWGNGVDDDDLMIQGNFIVDKPETEGSTFLMFNNPRMVVKNGNIYVRNVDREIMAAFLTGEIRMIDNEGNPNSRGELVVKGNATLNDFTFNGSMYVQGNVKIIGDLNMQGVLFVTGDVDLKDMRSINPPRDGESNQLGAPLIIAANKNISLNSLRRDGSGGSSTLAKADDPIRIRAFLYSNSDVELFGVVSSYQIIGGVYGKNVTLNAVRGDFSSVPQPNLQYNSDKYYFEDQTQEKFKQNKAPRLQLLYDPRLFSNPPYGIPWSDRVRVYVNEVASED